MTTIISDHDRRQTHQNCAASPPGKCGSGDVHAPDPGQQRQRHEDRRHDRQHLHHLVEPVADVRQVRVEDAGDAILEDQRIVGDADEVVVDVAEPERHLGADVDEVAPRQPGDDVALRRDDPPQRRDVALFVEDPPHQRRVGLLEDRRSRARRADPRACRPRAGSDRPSRRRCGGTARPALRRGSSVLRVHVLAQLVDRPRVAVVHGDEIVRARGRNRRRAWRSSARPPWKSMPCRMT